MVEDLHVVNGPKHGPKQRLLPTVFSFDDDECAEWLVPINLVETLPPGLIEDEV